MKLAPLALAMAVSLSGTALAQELPALFDVTGVAADDVLNIRELPSASAGIVGELAPTATGIEVVGLEGNWAIVNHGEGSGYVSLDYLTHGGQPDWNELGLPLACFGTEPFWSLQWNPADRVVTLHDFDTTPATLPVRQVWGVVPMSDLAALEMDGGMAILRPRSCSDGMSDITYGIAIDLFLTGPSGRGLYGCCSLTPR